MTLVNTGSVRHSLVAVTTPAFAEVSIHESREAQGMSAMRPVSSIILEPKVPVRFAPGGYHLMLMRPVRPIRVGDTVIMTLHFAEAPPVDVAFYVRAGEAG
jgi:copper(I)-binding protein